MNTIQKIIAAAVFAALICAGWMIAIPLGPIPLVLQNALAILSGLVLGPVYGSCAVLIFLLLGAVGLPVFSGGRGGIAVFAGPTGGFLAGYCVGAAAAGLIMLLFYRKEYRAVVRYAVITVAACTGFICIYVLGLPWFKYTLGLTWPHTFAKGCIPFILPDAIKAVITVLITAKVIPVVRRFLSQH
ncbi:MAG: biotin transporter BioY [Treponema sp.]